MSRYPENVLRLAVPDLPNAYIFVSGRMDEDREYVKPNLSFAYILPDVAAEWMPPHGPIQIVRKCESDAEGAKPHHIYAHQNASPLEWSQTAVENEGLPRALVDGDHRYLFTVLRQWASGRSRSVVTELLEVSRV